ncbi:MAG: hypothetical protein LPH21_15660 [Shewanella sp.]|nr:hypothetical protein [Shewanella sp.]MCF1431531.1 hypothetical protein [Shewanella sp.]MCF1458924.1 hypothetical protein [Shewanella sp.]
MKTMSNSLSFSTKLILLATPLLVNQAYAYSGNCETLHLLVPESIYQKYQVSSGNPVVYHGISKGCDKVDTETAECLDYVFGQTTFAFGSGPDIDIEFKESNGDKTAKIRVQQNYCFLEAGHITVEPRKGGFEYNITEGSYGDNTPGLVTITSIEAL